MILTSEAQQKKSCISIDEVNTLIPDIEELVKIHEQVYNELSHLVDNWKEVQDESWKVFNGFPEMTG